MISNKSLAIFPEITPSPISSTMVPSCAAEIGDEPMSCPSRFKRPKTYVYVAELPKKVQLLAVSVPWRRVAWDKRAEF